MRCLPSRSIPSYSRDPNTFLMMLVPAASAYPATNWLRRATPARSYTVKATVARQAATAQTLSAKPKPPR